jgi:excinuclease UvrABC ATPase subunit
MRYEAGPSFPNRVHLECISVILLLVYVRVLTSLQTFIIHLDLTTEFAGLQIALKFARYWRTVVELFVRRIKSKNVDRMRNETPVVKSATACGCRSCIGLRLLAPVEKIKLNATNINSCQSASHVYKYSVNEMAHRLYSLRCHLRLRLVRKMSADALYASTINNLCELSSFGLAALMTPIIVRSAVCLCA